MSCCVKSFRSLSVDTCLYSSRNDYLTIDNQETMGLGLECFNSVNGSMRCLSEFDAIFQQRGGGFPLTEAAAGGIKLV